MVRWVGLELFEVITEVLDASRMSISKAYFYKRSALHRMFCELGDKPPIPANPISFGAIAIAPYAGSLGGESAKVS